ncbi:NUDIX hydrolase [Candidatus Dependentiae bacterium]|nr:NUDIX hydrolase [Candidatus Dependentiae bacterium]
MIKLLYNYHPASPDEIEYKSRMLDFIEKYSNCFERSLEVGHITASCWLLNKDSSKALLMHHAKLDKWFQLGGHCDGDPDTLAVAVKEAQEESGIMNIKPISDKIFDIDIHLIPENKKEKAHYHYDVRFLLQVVGDDEIIQNNESKALKWITKNRTELPTREESVVRMFNKWMA